MGLQRPNSKRRGLQCRAAEAKDNDSGANFSKAQGERHAYSRWSTNGSADICRSPLPDFLNNKCLNRPRLERSHEVSYVMGPI